MAEVVPGNGESGHDEGGVESGRAASHGTGGSVRVSLSPAQRSAVAAEAKRRGVPMTVLVRGMIDHFMPAIGVSPEGADPVQLPDVDSPSSAAPPYGRLPDGAGTPQLPGPARTVGPDGPVLPGPLQEVPYVDPLPGVPGGALPVDARSPLGPVPYGAGVDRSLVVPGSTSESGVVVMLPGAGPDGRPRMARIPIASYVSQTTPPSGVFAFLAGAPRFIRYAILLFAVLTVCMTFAYLGSTLVASRYAFTEVETAPGRSTFYRVDRWTGRMVRCSSTVVSASAPASDPPPVC